MAIEIPTLPEHMPNDALRYVGKPVNRVEDPALVSGTVQFIDNLSLPGMLHCAILRSPFPLDIQQRTGKKSGARQELPTAVANYPEGTAAVSAVQWQGGINNALVLSV